MWIKSGLPPTSLHFLVVLFVVSLTILIENAHGQVPESITIQGLLTNLDGSPVEAPSVNMTLYLYDAPSGGSTVWGSAPVSVNLNEGLYELTIDQPSFAAVPFNLPLWYQLYVNGELLEPRRPLSSVPYALGLRGFQITPVPGDEAPNIVGGYVENRVGDPVHDEEYVGGTISGGGRLDESDPLVGLNTVEGDYGTVGGGAGNIACINVGPISGEYCTVGGGKENMAYNAFGTIAGGRANIAPGAYGAVGGGLDNLVGSYSAVPGGELNQAAAPHTFAAGYRARANHSGCFVWNDRSLTSGTDADNLATTAQNQFLIRAAGGVGVNTNTPLAGGLSVNGIVESRNSGFKFPDGTTQSSAGWGLSGNAGTTPGTHFIGTTDDQAFEIKVDGVRAMRISPGSEESGANIIGGYWENGFSPGVHGATIAGGGNLDVANRVTGSFGAVCGGVDNKAGPEGFVGGGLSNWAFASVSTVSGGNYNDAYGKAATVPGGAYNAADGDYSFAAGYRARVRSAAEVGDTDGDEGSFVWSDASSSTYFTSSGPNQFLVRSNGGVRIVKGTDAPTSTLAAFQVESDFGAEVGWLKQRAVSTYAVLSLLKPTASTNVFMEGNLQDSGPATRKFHISSNGTYVTGSDIAESMAVVGSVERYEEGDVLVISRSEERTVELSSRPNDSAVIGVYSTRPGFLGADKGGETRVDEHEIPVAIAGIVPVKASAENGSIYPGDLLTTSNTPGHVMRADPIDAANRTTYATGTIVGKALGRLLDGTGAIQMFVMPQ